MHRSPFRATEPYRVNFAPEAWKQVGRISTGAFLAFQVELERIASEMGAERPQGEGAHSELRTVIAGLRVIYQRDDATRTLTLLEIVPASAESP